MIYGHNIAHAPGSFPLYHAVFKTTYVVPNMQVIPLQGVTT